MMHALFVVPHFATKKIMAGLAKECGGVLETYSKRADGNFDAQVAFEKQSDLDTLEANLDYGPEKVW